MLTELVKPTIQEVPRSAGATQIVLPRQLIAKVLTPGEIEVGLRESSLSRFEYSSDGLIVCRKGEEEWVRWSSPMRLLLVPIPQHSIELAKEETGCATEAKPTPHLEDPRILALLNAIQAETETGFPSDGLFMESIFLALATALLPGGRAIQRALERSTLTGRQLRTLEEFMHANLEKNLRLSDLAEVLQLSPGHFAQSFRKAKGSTPHQYLLSLRLRRARQLLESQTMRIVDVAVACGFRNQQHFATSFRGRYGMPPSEFRGFPPRSTLHTVNRPV